MFREAHSLKNAMRWAWSAREVNVYDHGTVRWTNRHIHLRNGVVLEILIVVIVENFIIIESHPFWPKHLREHLELLVAETLVLSLLFGPVILLRWIVTVSTRVWCYSRDPYPVI